jgi:hypothetical protein
MVQPHSLNEDAEYFTQEVETHGYVKLNRPKERKPMVGQAHGGGKWLGQGTITPVSDSNTGKLFMCLCNSEVDLEG